MNTTSKKYLFDIVIACDEITAFISGKTRDDYFEDPLLRRAVERDLEIIGEATYQLRNADPNTIQLIPEAAQMIGMRHRLIHAYAQVSDDIVWDTATYDLPALRNVITELLRESTSEDANDRAEL